MALLSPTTVLVGVLLLYLFSFIVFAIVRIATGVSIQRIGYFSLRRIAYSPLEGVHIELRGLGLSFHQPSFSRPTWVSLRLTDLKVTVNPVLLETAKAANAPTNRHDGDIRSRPSTPHIKKDISTTHRTSFMPRSKTWKRLTSLKERIKKLHRQIRWLAMVDLVATNSIVHFVDAGQIQVGSFTLAVDTRRKMVEMGNLFRHKKRDRSREQHVAEWMMSVSNILLLVDGREPTEILDSLQLNIHGHMYADQEGLRDASVAVKVGRLHLPYDELKFLSNRVRGTRAKQRFMESPSEIDEVSFADIVRELDQPGSREEAIVQTVADSKEFASSILRGIEEIQIALSFFRISQSLQTLSTTHNAIKLNIVTHEVGIDVHRMNPNTPAHRMYFQPNDVAHQALLAAISLSVNLDDGSGGGDRILYIPMATTTMKTTLPSKTVSFSGGHDPAERNSNVLFANLVVTSPSMDLEPRHVSQLLGLTRPKASTSLSKKRDSHHIISRLLPKASIKLSVHEPVIRFVLPISETTKSHPGDFNLLISSISSLSLDVESSHSAETGVHYSLSSIYRVASHHLYYQTPTGDKHNLLQTDNMEVRMHLNATPDLCVVLSGTLNSFSIHMVNEDVNRGIGQVFEQFKSHMLQKSSIYPGTEAKTSFLRKIPPWLLRAQFEATSLNFEVAGIDQRVSDNAHGISFQLESWSADYRAQKSEPTRAPPRRRTASHSTVGDDSAFKFSPSPPHRRSQNSRADGRRLAVHIRGLEGFAIEADDYLEPKSFLSLPRCEVAFSTQRDLQGPIFHINSVVKGFFMELSLYRYYSFSVASSVLRDTFMHQPSEAASSVTESLLSGFPQPSRQLPQPQTRRVPSELSTVDIRIGIVQVKGIMPADPPMMLQIYGFAAGRHRWSPPFLRCHLARLHVEAPKLKGIWARVLSMNSVRLDLRETKQRHGKELLDEKTVDLSADFIRLGVPHHMVMHRVFDNITNTFKAVKQLSHGFKTWSQDFAVERRPEGPKIVPRVSIRSKALLFELEDDAFEWKLGCIYRAGLVEQRHRLSREEAFRLKSQRLKGGERRGDSRFRAHSAHAESILGRQSAEWRRRSGSMERKPRRPVELDENTKGKFRYDAEGCCRLSSLSKVSATEAWRRLQEYNSRSWKKKIDAAMKFQTSSIRQIRSLFAGADEPPEDADDDEPVLSIPDRPGLMSALISDLHLVVDKPTFPLADCASFLHKIGKGMPLDMKYSLLIPMYLHLDVGEARVTLRDYPLDLLHIPGLRSGQSPKTPSWSLKTHLVIAEEFRDIESSRDVRVKIVPSVTLADGSSTPGYFINVRRTVSPVKTYSDPTFEINTSLPTSFTWAMSYQPVIQDMMKIIEGFTKPEIDPSERVGFWDKIRLSFHSRLRVRWNGDGDVHLRLKGMSDTIPFFRCATNYPGSRDPYCITGFGAGFVMCWRKDVQWDIHTSNDPKQFMSVTSGEYVLAVPDYSHEARYTYQYSLNDGDESSIGSAKKSALFKKVVMKLSGPVRWLAGLVFERSTNEGRSFNFRPHYDVVLKNPRYITLAERPVSFMLLWLIQMLNLK